MKVAFGLMNRFRALLPDLIRFAFIPRDQLQINADGTPGPASKERRDKSPDFSAFTFSDSTSGFSRATQHEDEHVLVLDFAAAKGSGKKPDAQMYAMPSSRKVLSDCYRQQLSARAILDSCCREEVN